MTDINLPVEWNESSELPYEGLYFVAVRYPNGFGSYDFALWNGNEWQLGYTAEVVGWVTSNDVLSLIKAGWPKGDNQYSEEFAKYYEENRLKKGNSPKGEDDFVEITDE